MILISLAILAAAAVLNIKMICFALRKKPAVSGKCVILPVTRGLIFCGCSILCGLISGFFLFREKAGGITLGFALLSLLLALGCLKCIHFKIEFYPEGFLLTDRFGREENFLFKDVERVLHKKETAAAIFVRGRRIRIPRNAVNLGKFLGYTKRQYRSKHGGEAVPQDDLPKPDDLTVKQLPRDADGARGALALLRGQKGPSSDIFRGAVRKPGRRLAVYIIIFVLLAALTVIVGIAWKAPIEGQSAIVNFEGGDFGRRSITLHYSGENYSVYQMKAVYDREELQRRVELRAQFTARYYEFVDEEYPENSEFRLLQLTGADGREFLDTDKIVRAERLRRRSVFWSILSSLLIWLNYCIISILAARDPDRWGRDFTRRLLGVRNLNI